jgi:hypothetical protein
MSWSGCTAMRGAGQVRQQGIVSAGIGVERASEAAE